MAAMSSRVEIKKVEARAHFKLMRLGLTNRIVNDWDFKPVDLDRRLPSDSKSNDESELTISISI